MNKPLISGYTTTYNCIEMRYPLIECLESLLSFCDEVVVVDAGSTDGTIGVMNDVVREAPQVKFYVEPVDFTQPRWAVQMDGNLKAKARAYCTGQYCWQTDTDEIVAPHDFERIRSFPELAGKHLLEAPVMYLPMVEFWGSFETIRADFFTWKPRFSLNDPKITHGIPKEYRMYDEQGHPYPKPFDSDSCNYIYKDTGESVKLIIPADAKAWKQESELYLRLFEDALDRLPSVQHVSWLNLERKIEHYRRFWRKFHASMYHLDEGDETWQNVMFDKPWSEVTSQDVFAKARELKELGPRSFHRKLDPSKRGLTVPFRRPVAPSLIEWAKRQERRS